MRRPQHEPPRVSTRESLGIRYSVSEKYSGETALIGLSNCCSVILVVESGWTIHCNDIRVRCEMVFFWGTVLW